MKVRKIFGLVILLGIGILVTHSVGRAMVLAPAPLTQRVATAECIVVGKVTGFTDKTVRVSRYSGNKEKSDYQVAIVRIDSTILGSKDAKEIRVGFLPPVATPQGAPIRPMIRRPLLPTLALGQEALLFLTKHPEADFYVMPAYYSAVNKKDNENFNKDVDEVKHCAELLADPKAGLDAKESSDRLLTATMLLTRYRQPHPELGTPKNEPIDREISKKILLTLADADWNARPGRPGSMQLTPQGIFYQLGLLPKDGWSAPRDFKQVPEAAKKWCRDHADSYVIHRLAYEKPDKK